MAINPDLLIAAPMLQDSFVDKDGTPMSGGTVTCYQDNSRTTLKNWYYQSSNSADSQGKYAFSPLPNPLTLSAAGTICDINGVDTIPFFYPFSELDQTEAQPYYITIVNHAQTNQITRPNFPYNPQDHLNPQGEGSVDNYIINNGFWRNIGSVAANPMTQITQKVICPSQHDGFRYPDIQFIKNNTSATDTITFTKFAQSINPILVGDITPEFYINHTCSGEGTGETQKCYQFPISLHINTLNAVQYTVTIQAQNEGTISTGENVIELFIFQDTGSGTSPPAPIPIGQITVNPNWQKYTFTKTFPSTAGLVLSGGGDDALYLQVQMPLNLICNINFTRPSIYLSPSAPTNSFMTYDQIDAIINSPRTGDTRTSMNSFYYFGWVPMNNGTIGNASSNATSRADTDTWQLFNLLWSLAKPYDSGSNFNPICQIYSSAGAATNYGVDAITDFNDANKQLALTQMLGNVIMGTVPSSALLSTYSQTVTASNPSGTILLFTLTGSAPANFYVGQPVTFTSTGSLPGNIVANAIYYVVNPSGNTFNVATSFANAIAGTTVNYSSTGSANTVIFQTTGSSIGEYSHLLTIGEMPSHFHGPQAGSTAYVQETGSGQTLAVNAGTLSLAANTGLTGGGLVHNNIPPETLYNIFMKL